MLATQNLLMLQLMREAMPAADETLGKSGSARDIVGKIASTAAAAAVTAAAG